MLNSDLKPWNSLSAHPAHFGMEKLKHPFCPSGGDSSPPGPQPSAGTSLRDHHTPGPCYPTCIRCLLRACPGPSRHPLPPVLAQCVSHTCAWEEQPRGWRAPVTGQLTDSLAGAWHTAGAQQVCVGSLSAGSKAAPPQRMFCSVQGASDNHAWLLSSCDVASASEELVFILSFLNVSSRA